MYSLTNVVEIVSSPVFNVSMFIRSLLVAVPFFISRSAASASHDVISGTSFGSVWIMVFCSLLFSSVKNFSIRSTILSLSRISLPCLSRSVFSGPASAFFGLSSGCWCRCRLVLVVSRIDFSIQVGIRFLFILFVWHLL